MAFGPTELLLIWGASSIASMTLVASLHVSYAGGRWPWASTMRLWASGATVALAIAILVETPFAIAMPDEVFLLAVIVAPPVEESAKLFALRMSRTRGRNASEGVLAGSIVGLGFAVIENGLYGTFSALLFGVDVALSVLLLRIVSSTFLHVLSTSLIGLGLARAGRIQAAIPFVGAAVALHAMFNATVLVAPGILVPLAGAGIVVFPMLVLRALWTKGGAPERMPRALVSETGRPPMVQTTCVNCSYSLRAPATLAWTCPRCKTHHDGVNSTEAMGAAGPRS